VYIYIERHHLTTSKALNVLVMREEKCVDVIVRVKIVRESSVSLSESVRDCYTHKQSNVLRRLSADTKVHHITSS